MAAGGDQPTLHIGYQGRQFCSRRLDKLLARKNYRFPVLLPDIQGIIKGLLADYSKSRSLLDYLSEKLEELKDSFEFGMLDSHIPENEALLKDPLTDKERIDQKIFELLNQLKRLLDEDLDKNKRIIEAWFNETCTVVKTAAGCLIVEVQFPIQGGFTLLFIDILSGVFNELISNKLSADAIQRFERFLQQTNTCVEDHENESKVFQKALSFFDVQLSCSSDEITNYLNKHTRSIKIKIEINIKLSNCGRLQMSRKGDKESLRSEFKVKKDNQDSLDFFELLNAVFDDADEEQIKRNVVKLQRKHMKRQIEQASRRYKKKELEQNFRIHVLQRDLGESKKNLVEKLYRLEIAMKEKDPVLFEGMQKLESEYEDREAKLNKHRALLDTDYARRGTYLSRFRDPFDIDYGSMGLYFSRFREPVETEKEELARKVINLENELAEALERLALAERDRTRVKEEPSVGHGGEPARAREEPVGEQKESREALGEPAGAQEEPLRAEPMQRPISGGIDSGQYCCIL